MIRHDNLQALLVGKTLVQLCEYEAEECYYLNVWTSGKHVLEESLARTGHDIFTYRKYARARGIGCQRVKADVFVATHRSWLVAEDADGGAVCNLQPEPTVGAAGVLASLTREIKEGRGLTYDDLEWALRKIRQYQKESA